MTESVEALRVVDLHKSFGHVEVLKGISLAVASHEVVCLIGASGSGKSTLLRCVNLLEPIDSGRIVVAGRDVTERGVDVNSVRRGIGIVFQAYNLFPHMSVLKNVTLAPRKVLGVPRDEAEARAKELLARFGLTEAGGRKASEYSGGMRRRLDIAMSLIGDPPVIFLDEPTTGLDPQGRIEVWQTVKELADSGTTVLLTTQYLDEAEQLADRIAILHQGRIIVNGTLAELKQLLPPAKVEYIEKQPSLEDVFLALVGQTGGTDGVETAGDTRANIKE